MSSSMLSPCVAQPGMAGTSAQKPPSSASCTTILIFIIRSPHRIVSRTPPSSSLADAPALLRRLRIHLCRYLADGAGELFGGLRAGHRVFLREHKSRNAGDALV